MTKPFARFVRKARIAEFALWSAALAASAGQVDADLGGGVVKQRIARPGQGKSGGSRTVLLVRRGERVVFVFGFEKKDRANLSAQDLTLFQELAPIYLEATDAQMEAWVQAGALRRIYRDKEENR